MNLSFPKNKSDKELAKVKGNSLGGGGWEEIVKDKHLLLSAINLFCCGVFFTIFKKAKGKGASIPDFQVSVTHVNPILP